MQSPEGKNKNTLNLMLRLPLTAVFEVTLSGLDVEFL